MVEEVAYAYVGSDSNKRKYEDSTSTVALRATGFSSPPDSATPPQSYNNVPISMNETDLAKQEAQEIAARLLNNVDLSKRARVGNRVVADLMLLMQVSKSQIGGTIRPR